ncbi:unnamed protein product [Paramecium sonneborni]|uniref:Uncharacterized protein n=1 Tax=Paramecium sonneborni TaxID=65129 RepID=A0A8S1RJF9_9CILI|nr:unnamed protein product [Paramecium sonneborni]
MELLKQKGHLFLQIFCRRENLASLECIDEIRNLIMIQYSFNCQKLESLLNILEESKLVFQIPILRRLKRSNKQGQAHEKDHLQKQGKQRATSQQLLSFQINTLDSKTCFSLYLRQSNTINNEGRKNEQILQPCSVLS